MAPSTASSLRAWASKAKRNATMVYYIGQIGKDRYDDPEIDRLAWAVEQLIIDGVITVTHKRLNPDQYAYMAIRSAGKYKTRPYGAGQRDTEALWTDRRPVMA